MKDKPSEWVAISDLMSGVLAVVMLLLVVAVLQKGVSDLRYQDELAKLKGSKNDAVVKVTQALGIMISQRGAAGLMALDAHSHRLTLRDGVFERGSACLKPEVKAALAEARQEIAHFLLNTPNARILVEGHTDNIPVNHEVTDKKRFCTVYDDNFTLSAARAREARLALIGTLDPKAARRVVVAGYGESRPLPDVDPKDSKNRRVEVQFLVEDAIPRTASAQATRAATSG
jgi:chemotaxis protein MotB